MAKKPEFNNVKKFERESRLRRIENCTQCHGSPEAKDFNLQGLVGKYCNTCMEIIMYTKEGKPIVVVEKKVIGEGFDPLKNDKTSSIKDIPFIPGIEFSELNVE